MKARWARIGRKLALWTAAVVVLLGATLAVLWETGRIEHWARAAVIEQVERATGGRVELGGFHMQLHPFVVELDKFTIHGREAAGEAPFVQIERVKVGLLLRDLFRGKVVLSDVAVDRPAISVQVDREGHSNVPVPPKRGPSKPWHQQLFSITIDRLRLNDGMLDYNNRHIPLSADGGRFTFAMDYSAPAPGRDFYRGKVGWQEMRIDAKRWLPFRSNWSAQFTVGRKGGSLDKFRLELPHSSVEARADWPDWTKPELEAHYRVQLNLVDVKTLLKKPHSPLGRIDSSGDLQYALGAWKLHGYYSARDIGINFKWYHASGMSSRGTLVADPKGLDIPDFQAWALGGSFTGRVHMNEQTLDFTAVTQSRQVSLAQILAAVQNSDFPVQTLHWEAKVEVDSVTTWRADFKDMGSSGQVRWTPLAQTPAGMIPATATIRYNYQMARDSVISQGEISTPNTQLRLDGSIGGRNSSMTVDMAAKDVRDWQEMINTLRGPEAQPAQIRGRATWQGSVTGRVSHPMFSGHVHAWDAGYDQLHWDEIEGSLAYSPDGLTLTNMRVRRGRSLATVSLHLNFTNWEFRPENGWNLNARLTRADTADLQGLAGTKYPAHGWLTGQFRGSGTRKEPQVSGGFQLDDFAAAGYRFPKVTGRVEVDASQVRLAGVTATFGSGTLGGDLSYLLASAEAQFDLFGRGLPLDEIRRLQSPALPLAGRIDFHVSGSGPVRAPRAQGTASISSLRAGNELFGDLNGRLNSDGRKLQVELTSSLVRGRMNGTVELTLADDYPIEGQLTATGIDLDPFIESGLHLRALTNHSHVDGRFQLSGQLLRPDTIAVQADVSKVEFSFETVTLENIGPLRLIYRKGEVSVERAVLKGTDSNFRLSGVVRFTRNQPLELKVAGAVNLKLIAAFVPELQSQGAAQMDALIEGTFGEPRISGRARLEHAALTYGDIPIGLSAVNGDLIFSSDHLSFTNLKAEAGGGQLVLGGTVNFAPSAGRVQYDIRINATQVRVRWPEGMSWLLDANARLAGDTRSADLSGQIRLDRLFLTNGLDVAGLLMATRQPVVETEGGTPFLTNLRLDFTVTSGPGSRLEWSGAHIETDANLRVRGTWSRPSVLGHVHLLSGEVSFRGNKYRLNRGDMNFANPLRLDPEMNVEATTTIQQYEVTVDLTGRASALRLAYRSDPPLPETDVISLLALGYTGEASELRTAGQPGQFGATALLSEAVSSEVGGRIARLFGISRFRIDPFQAGTGTESNAAARITIEQQVTPELTITYATNATSNAEQVIQIEYSVSRRISIVALRDINGTFGINIEFKKRFH
jgi:translocation and assembly module TamB